MTHLQHIDRTAESFPEVDNEGAQVGHVSIVVEIHDEIDVAIGARLAGSHRARNPHVVGAMGMSDGQDVIAPRPKRRECRHGGLSRASHDTAETTRVT